MLASLLNSQFGQAHVDQQQDLVMLQVCHVSINQVEAQLCHSLCQLLLMCATMEQFEVEMLPHKCGCREVEAADLSLQHAQYEAVRYPAQRQSTVCLGNYN